MRQHLQISNTCLQQNDQQLTIDQKRDAYIYQCISQNDNIDKQNVSAITSVEYLKNYTYLQFALFPELFNLYLNKLSLNQLKSQLVSYVSTFLQFFHQETIYQRYHQTNLAQQIILKFNGDGNNKISQIIDGLFSDIKTYLNDQSCNRLSILSLKRITQKIDSLDGNHAILNTIKIQVFRNPLIFQLFDLLYQIIKRIIERKSSFILYHWSIPTYIYQLCIEKMIQQKQFELKDLQSSSKDDKNKAQKSAQYLIDIIELKIIPFELELRYLNEHIINAKTKQFYVFKLITPENNMSWYWQLFDMISLIHCKIQKLRQKGNNYQNKINTSDNKNNKNESGRQCYESKTQFDEVQRQFRSQIENLNKYQTFNELYKSIKLSISTQYLEREKQCINKQKPGLFIQGKQKIKSENNRVGVKLKQLGAQSSDKISKLLARVKQYEVSFQQSMDIENNDKFNPNDSAIKQSNYSLKKPQLQQEIQLQPKQISISLDILSEPFFIKYCKASEKISNQSDFALKHHKKLSENMLRQNDTQESILQDLFSTNNKSLCEILKLNITQLNQLNKLITKVELQEILILDLVDKWIQRFGKIKKQRHIISSIDTTMKLSEKINPQKQKQTKNAIDEQRKAWQKMKKIKNSLFVNLLTIRIIKSALKLQMTQSQQSQSGPYIKEESRKDIKEQPNQDISGIHDIKQLFNEIFNCISISIYNGQQNETNKQQKIQKKQQQKQYQIAIYPSLQSILYMFSSIQLWFQCSQTQLNSISQIQSFFQTVIRRYSHSGIKIDPNQIVFVNYIITICDILKDMNVLMRQKTQNINQVQEAQKNCLRIQKIIKLSKNNHSNIRLQNLLNLNFCTEKYLKELMVKLLNYCNSMCKQNIQQKSKINRNELFTQENTEQKRYKIPFCKLISFKNKKFEQQNFLQCFQESIISKSNAIFSKNSQFNRVVNIDESTISQRSLSLSQANTHLDTMHAELEMLQYLKQKHMNLNRVKRAIKNKIDQKAQNNQKQIIINLDQSIQELTFNFLLQMIASTSQICFDFNDINKQYKGVKNSNQLHEFALHFKSSLTKLKDKISLKVNHLIDKCLKDIINTKMKIFKISPQQIYCLLVQEGKQTSQQNKQKCIQKIKARIEYLDSIIQFSLIMFSFLFWMKSQTEIKLNYQNIGHKKQQCSLSLLRYITLLSLLPQDSFCFNFELIQSYLFSNVQNIDKNKNQTIFQNYRFSKVSLQNLILQSEIQFISNNQFLQFIYEYFPFDIDTQKEQLQLLNFSKSFTINQENHQFLGRQKQQKIRFTKITEYLTVLCNNLPQNL